MSKPQFTERAWDEYLSSFSKKTPTSKAGDELRT